MKSAIWSSDSPYLLMEVREMLAEEGMLYDDVCLGTKATTHRSDTCEETNEMDLLVSKCFGDIHILIRSEYGCLL